MKGAVRLHAVESSGPVRLPTPPGATNAHEVFDDLLLELSPSQVMQELEYLVEAVDEPALDAPAWDAAAAEDWLFSGAETLGADERRELLDWLRQEESQHEEVRS